MPRLLDRDLAALRDGDDAASDRFSPPARRADARPRLRPDDVPYRPRERRDAVASFRCGRCRAFVGPIRCGGRHRNHCPLCLTSRHVDLRRPGDRANPCRGLMAPVGTAFRPDGEQTIVHRCNQCGEERRVRVAADDLPEALLRLPLAPPRPGRAANRLAEEEAIA